MKAAAMLAVLGVLSTMLVSTIGYSTGPPVNGHPEICQDMFPSGHNAVAQTVAAPFDVTVTCNCYVPGMRIYVNYTKTDTKDPLEGIFLQARPTTGVTNVAVGDFSVGTNQDMTTLKCNDNPDSAVGHNKEIKERSKGSCWQAPDNLDEGVEVEFVATALLHKAEFWTFVKSETIKPCPGGKVPDTCLTTVINDDKYCSNGGTVLHPVGLVTVLSTLLVLLTKVISF